MTDKMRTSENRAEKGERSDKSSSAKGACTTLSSAMVLDVVGPLGVVVVVVFGGEVWTWTNFILVVVA